MATDATGSWNKAEGTFSEDSKVVVLCGATGVGKSSTANFLVTATASVDGHGSVDRQPFYTAATSCAGTNDPEGVQAHFLGDSNLPVGVVVDTPGLEDLRGREQDEAHIRNIIKLLKKLKKLNTLVLELDTNPRIAYSTLQLIKCLCRSMEGIEKHLCIVVNKWKYDDVSIVMRKRPGGNNEAKYIAEIVDYLTSPADEMGLGFSAEDAMNIPFFFVDAAMEPEFGKQYSHTYEQMLALVRHVTSSSDYNTLGVEYKALHEDLEAEREAKRVAEASLQKSQERSAELLSRAEKAESKMGVGDFFAAVGRGAVAGLTWGLAEIPWTGKPGSSLGSLLNTKRNSKALGGW